MKAVYAVKKGDTFVALFEEQSAAYSLRDELPDAYVDKHLLFEDLPDREDVRSV